MLLNHHLGGCVDADETEMWAYGQGQWVIVDTLVRLTGKVKRIGYGHHTPVLDDFPRSVINVQFVALAKITITQDVTGFPANLI